MRHDMETLWLNLDVQPLEGETQEELQIQSVRVCLKLKLRPVQYTVNDFELVATISRGSSYAFGSELLYVQDRDTKKVTSWKFQKSYPIF